MDDEGSSDETDLHETTTFEKYTEKIEDDK